MTKVPDSPEGLTELFRRLGAPHPERWARSQLSEGIPQLHRYLWLRQAWNSIVVDEDYEWMDREIKRAHSQPGAPYSGVGNALQRCLEKGANREDLNEIVRGKQAELLFRVCCLLEDPNFAEDELRSLSWGIFETDDGGNPKKRITGLHESVLETDPTGRQMRPKKSV